ncbi:NADPH dehydrogenase [Streptomyces violaceorubidus]
MREQFRSAAARAAGAGFDLLELHCAHGYLLSGFLAPLTNHRTDAYGGSLEKRLRFPLEVFDAVREVWPGERPMTVRISATDWAEGGTSAEEAVEIARAFAAHGADALDVSTGQVVAGERPEFGRSYQTPYADRIRHEAGVPVIAVGAISSWDDVNSLILAGRTDLCALARPHLYDPHWTLHAAAEQDARPGAPWPAPYRGGQPPTAHRAHRRPQAEAHAARPASGRVTPGRAQRAQPLGDLVLPGQRAPRLHAAGADVLAPVAQPPDQFGAALLAVVQHGRRVVHAEVRAQAAHLALGVVGDVLVAHGETVGVHRRASSTAVM